MSFSFMITKCCMPVNMQCVVNQNAMCSLKITLKCKGQVGEIYTVKQK